MRIKAYFHGILSNNKIILKANDENDLDLINKMFKSKSEREQRSNKEILLECELDAAFQHRSFKQLAAVWKLVEVIFESENNRKPTEQEKYELYLDLLMLYADKIPNRYNNELRSIHISEANTVAAAHFIDGLLYHLATMCNLTYDQMATVRGVLYAWEIWRGTLDHDINDDRTPEELRKYVRTSEASGRQPVELHHIITRGACPLAADKAWNLVALTHDEHMEFHQKGWDYFLDKYPHLKGKFERAKKKCSELVQESHSLGTESLADLALSVQND